jgi:predicted small metal-binding protein
MTKEVVCREAGYDCDFMMRSEDESQLVDFVKEHARESHGTEVSSQDIRSMWKTV